MSAMVRLFVRSKVEEPNHHLGMFLYYDESNETDIEWISDPASFANIDQNNGTRAMLYTNQGPNGNEDATTVSGVAARDATSRVHEYRLDWTPSETRFYLDGQLQQTIRQSVSACWSAQGDDDTHCLNLLTCYLNCRFPRLEASGFGTIGCKSSLSIRPCGMIWTDTFI